MRSLDPIYFAPQRKPCGGWLCWKDSPSPPPAPNYAAAAQQTAQGSVQASIANNLMAHPNIYTPLGSQTWTPSGSVSVPGIGDPDSKNYTPGFDVPTYNQSINMSPEGQALYDQQMRLSKAYGNIGEQGLDRIGTAFNKPMDEAGVRELQDRAYAAQTSRLDPQWSQMEKAQDSKLANQGIMQGSEAYNNAQRSFGEQRNDAYTQARLAAASQAPSLLQQELAIRNQPLTEVNALRTGAQPQMPQFQASQYSMGAQGPNMLGAASQQYGAAMDQYNAQVGANNGMMSGILGLGGAALMAPTGTFTSDRRLKRNIVRVFDDPRGFGWYTFRYLWDAARRFGVMADEVPHAATRHVSGFMQVDYGRL